jgi:Molybdopterin converting factor, small subunit
MVLSISTSAKTVQRGAPVRIYSLERGAGMNVKVLYFARLRERFGLSEEVIELPDSMAMVAMLLDVLRARGGEWAEALAAGQNFVSR